jgi:hypothetical protein
LAAGRQDRPVYYVKLEGTAARGKKIRICRADVDLDQGRGWNRGRTTLSFRLQFAFGAAIKRADDRFKPQYPGRLVALKKSAPQTWRSNRCQAAMMMNSRVIAMPAAP